MNIGLQSILLITLIISRSHSKTSFCNETKDKSHNGDLMAVEHDYEVRPNIFIDKDHLLGTKAKDLHKKTFAYGNGPYGPSHWSKMFPKCGGKHQSPINIEISSLKTAIMPPLKWSPLYEELPLKITLSNTHNTLEMMATFKDNALPTIEGGPLSHPYAMHSLHFHWSASDHRGSEHTVNRKSFPMEMHVVHYRSDLNVTEAKAQDKGLCVLAYIFEIGEKCNEALTNLMAVTDQTMLEPDSQVELTNLFRLDNLMDKIVSDYVTYSGSLTTPPCYESVIWIISPYTMTLHKKQIERFRSVSMSASGFGDNFRAVQPLNGRVVQFVKSGSSV